MKTTIKLALNRAVTVSPSPAGVLVEFKLAGVVVMSDVITPDQAGALVVGIEHAAKEAAQKQDAGAQAFWAARA